MRGFLLVFTLNGLPRAMPHDSWFGPDKVQHFFASAFVQSMSYGSLRAAGASHGAALAGATATTAAVGVGKEIHDLRVKGDFSVRDLAWDAAGAGAATVLLVRVAR
jgi:putative lipoprotein